MMHQAERNNHLKGIKLSTRGPSISHLLFADDSLFFTLANQRSCKAIKTVLSKYEEVSGQAVNLRKSAITFGKNVKPETKRRMRNLLGIHNEGGGGKYLGLPEQFDKKKSELFRYIVERVKEKTQGWNKKYLSQAGKEVMLKAVALAMPIYSMNVFKLPKEICSEICGILAKFWWGSGGNSGMHWLAWDRLSLPKREGGLGFRDLESFNLALLGKQTWRLLQYPDSLMAKTLKGRYYQETNILNATRGRKASFIWKSILHGRDLVKKGLRFCIGDGSTIDAWLDPWLPIHLPRPPIKLDGSPSPLLVQNLLNQTRTGWDTDKIRDWVDPQDAATIMNIKVCPTATQDLLGWHYTRHGFYTVKSGYWLATHLPDFNQAIPPQGDILLKQNLWKSKTAPKLKHFCWRIISKAIPTGENLKYRHITTDATCVRCCREDESTNHLFFNCEYAQAIWRSAGIPNPILLDTNATLEDKLRAILHINSFAHTSHIRQLPLWILWRIWKSRNVLMFQNRNIPWRESLRYAKQDAKEWQEAEDYTTEGTTAAPRQCASRTQRLWTRPPPGWLKCNYDATFTVNTPVTAGWVLRDEQGTYRGAGHARGTIPTSSLESELQALTMAMQHCWSRGIRKLYFEGDNKDVTDILNGRKPNFAVYNWIREISSWKTRFEECRFTWVRRGSNLVADTLAKHTLSNNCFHFYDFVPPVITSFLHRDYVTARQ